MLWPTPADYAQAVGGFPDVSLLDSKLRGGRPKTDSTIGLLVYSGGFSTVFPIEVATDVYALRCWTRDIGDAKNRYEKISAYLKKVRLRYFVDFKYVPEGILINDKRYPITRMEWSEGELLRDFIDQNLQNATIFRTVADEFRKMVADLHTHRISHGDLQNGNILVKKDGTDVEIKLIDYDSLFVPDLHGQPSPTPGLPEYQHPIRITGGGQANETVDYFSELVIYLSFLSLAEKPELWDRFKDKTEKGLLFSKMDFENPDQSDIFKELANLSFDVQQLAATLKDFCAKTSLDELEPLEAVLPNPPKTIWQKITDVWYPLTEAWQQIPDVWQQIIRGVKNNQRFITAGTLSLALVICFVAFLTQMDAKNVALLQSTELTKKLNQKESEIRQQRLENQGLTSSVQTLKGSNQTLENTNQRLKQDNSELRNELENMISGADEASENVINLWRQLNEQEDENQNLRNQLSKKNTEIRQLRSDKAVALSGKRRLQRQLVEDRQGTVNQDATVQQLRTEKFELQSQNQNLIRQNQRLRNEKKALQDQLNDAKTDVARKELDNGQPVDIVRPEPPRHIDVYRDNATLASVRNNDVGITAFILKDYNRAVTYFKQAVQADLNLAITHYNLGCVYLEIREYGRAISAFGKAVAINHEFEEAYYNLGLAHLGKGAREQAKSSAELALRIDKNYQRAQNLLDILEKAQ